MLKVLKVGIAPYEEIKKKLLAVARGEYKFHKNEPRVWFSSIESLAQVLSTKNQLLLEIIDQSRPQSLSELAELSGRHKSNLSRSLKTLERYGLIELNHKSGKIQPVVKFKHFQIGVDLEQKKSNTN